mgnify:CR=1 FL=1
MSETDLTPDSPITNDTLREIVQFLESNPVRFVHYVGNADERLIKTLIAAERYEISLLDRHDKYGATAHFFWEEGDPPVDEEPEWLKGVTCFIEGGPDRIDALIWDDRWHFPNQLDKILHFHPNKRPHFVVLVGAAVAEGRHHFYDWTERSGVFFGRLKAENRNR